MATNRPLCLYPFANISQKTNSVCTPCCTYRLTPEETEEFKKFENSVEAFYSPAWDKLRQAMHGETLPPGCHRCAQKERLADVSMRLGSFGKFQEDLGIQEIEIFLGNDCNFKCRSCGPTRSSKWVSDAKALGVYGPMARSVKRGTIPYEDKRLSNLKYVRLLGGEPFVGDYITEILSAFERMGLLGQIEFDVVTNSSIRPSAKVLELLSRAKKVSLGLSVDGIGAAAEYIRKGTVWPTVDKVLRSYRDNPPNFRNYVHITLSAYNLTRVHEIFDYLLAAEPFFEDICFGIVDAPEGMRPTRLPLEFRRQYRDFLLSQHPLFNGSLQVSWLKEIEKNMVLNLLQDPEEDPAPLFSFTKTLDTLRNENVLEIFPEFRAFWENEKKEEGSRLPLSV